MQLIESSPARADIARTAHLPAARGVVAPAWLIEALRTSPVAALAGVSLRAADDTDISFLAAVYAAAREAELAAVAWTPAARREFLQLQFLLQHRYYREHYADADFLVIEAGGHRLGRLYWCSRGDHAVLMDISLLPAARGRGLGGALLALLTARADQQGQDITLHVEPANPAKRLYDRHGFQVEADNQVYLRMRRRAGNGS